MAELVALQIFAIVLSQFDEKHPKTGNLYSII